jgi:hypothetical protein
MRKPVMVLKIATSGLSSESRILGLSMVFDTGVGKLTDQPRLCLAFKYDEDINWEDKAHKMHYNWYQKILKGEQRTYELIAPEELKTRFSDFMSNEDINSCDNEGIYLLGRSLSRFCFKELSRHGMNHISSHPKFHYNIIDFSSLYLKEFKELLHPLMIFKKKDSFKLIEERRDPLSFCFNYLKLLRRDIFDI